MAEGRPDADPTRVVADADVLAADLLVGGPPRDALDHLRQHSWMTLVASDPLLDDAEAVIRELADESLAADWRARTDVEREPVEQTPGDHPGLASAVEGGAAHLLTLEDGLGTAKSNLSMQPHFRLSIRSPSAFEAIFDAEGLYEATQDGEYSGPDRDPRE